MLSPIDPGVAKHTGESPRGRRGINCLEADPASLQYPITNTQVKVERNCHERAPASIQYPITNASTTLSTGAQGKVERTLDRSTLDTHTLTNPTLLTVSLSYRLTHPSVAEALEWECNSIQGAKETHGLTVLWSPKPTKRISFFRWAKETHALTFVVGFLQGLEKDLYILRSRHRILPVKDKEGYSSDT